MYIHGLWKKLMNDYFILDIINKNMKVLIRSLRDETYTVHASTLDTIFNIKDAISRMKLTGNDKQLLKLIKN